LSNKFEPFHLSLDGVHAGRGGSGTKILMGHPVEKLAQNVEVHRNTLFRVLNGRVDPLIIEMNRVYLFLGVHGVLLRKGGLRFLYLDINPLKGMKALSDEFMLHGMERAIQAIQQKKAISSLSPYLPFRVP